MNPLLFLFSGKMINDVFSGYSFQPYDIELSLERRLRRQEARARIRARAKDFWTSLITFEQRMVVRFQSHTKPVAVHAQKVRK